MSVEFLETAAALLASIGTASAKNPVELTDQEGATTTQSCPTDANRRRTP
jgi:hypothetical protein